MESDGTVLKLAVADAVVPDDWQHPHRTVALSVVAESEQLVTFALSMMLVAVDDEGKSPIFQTSGSDEVPLPLDFSGVEE